MLHAAPSVLFAYGSAQALNSTSLELSAWHTGPPIMLALFWVLRPTKLCCDHCNGCPNYSDSTITLTVSRDIQFGPTCLHLGTLPHACPVEIVSCSLHRSYLEMHSLRPWLHHHLFAQYSDHNSLKPDHEVLMVMRMVGFEPEGSGQAWLERHFPVQMLQRNKKNRHALKTIQRLPTAK